MNNESAMKNINLANVILILTVFVFTLSACVTNQSKNKNYNSENTKSSHVKKTKSTSPNRGSQRNSVKHHSKSSIMVSNLGSNDQTIENAAPNRVSYIEEKCSLKGQCVKLIQHKIIDLWQYPRSYPKYKTILVLDLSRKGYITTIKLKRSSGVRAFDDSVIKAVRQAAPFTEITYLPALEIAEFSSIEMVFKR
jgi:TonB family protein